MTSRQSVSLSKMAASSIRDQYPGDIVKLAGMKKDVNSMRRTQPDSLLPIGSEDLSNNDSSVVFVVAV